MSYVYYAAGNIQTVSKSGTVYDQYAYDELGQLIREDNKDANKSYTYTYDSRGNILEKKTYAFTLGTLGTAQKTDSYGYATDSWKDRLTSYNGSTITYDSIGNPLTYNNGSAYTFTWEGRQMQTATKGNTTWTYTYNADGLRIGKTNGTTTYTYTWNENRQLSSMVCGTSSAWFYYDHEGKPLYMEYADGNDECSGIYRYILNLQGDVVGLYDLTRDCMAMTYTYDAWGRELSWSTLNSGYAGLLYGNPLTYRGYIYDRETGFYYLQSRYYDPTIGRFLNADDTDYLGASGTLLSWNLFAYCENSVVYARDPQGHFVITTTMLICAGIGALVLGVAGGFAGYYISKKMSIPKGSRWKYIAGGALIGAAIGAAAGLGIGYCIGGGSVVAVVGKSGSAISTKALNLGNKLSYIFGKATGSTHNVQRSKSMYSLLNKIGIWDNKFGNEYLTKCIIEIYK